MKRRFVLTALGAGALLVGWGVMPPRARTGRRDTLPVAEGAVGLNGWLRIAEGDGGVQLAMPRAEMGQGVHHALTLLVAEQLDIAPGRITLFDAGADSLYGNVAGAVDAVLWFEPGDEGRLVRGSRLLLAKSARELGLSLTGGSSSIADAWDVLPLAAATARAQLLGAASLLWKLPVAELVITDGTVSHPSGPKAHFGELAKTAASTPPGDVALKARADWKLVGRAQPRRDLPAKVNGSAVYGIDVRRPAQLFAVVLMGRGLADRPGLTNADTANGLRVVRLPPLGGAPAALAVVGPTTWHALQGARALQVQWQAAPGRAPDSRAIAVELEAQARAALVGSAGFTFRDRGDARSITGARRLEALYRAPYLAHAALEPLNCTAQVAEGRVRLWAPTQVPTFARAAAEQVAGVPESAVELNVPYLGGGFGRRLEVDVIAQAVRVALETGGRPVQLLWPREQDFTHDYYRPAGAAVLRAELDEQGRALAVSIGSAGDAIMPRYYERVFPLAAGPADPPDKNAVDGLTEFPYALPHLRITHVSTRSGVPVGSWRSVGHSHFAFMAEAFVDELAEAATADPVEFRLGLLKAHPRHAAVLQRAAQEAGWGRPLPAGRARGVALHGSFGSIVAMVAEVSLSAGKPRVHRITTAIDCGTAVDPGVVRQQVESAAMFGLAAALHGRIDIHDGVVQQRNFPDQPLVTLADTPAIDVHVIASEAAPAGVGEPGVPPLAPAVANALYALTGRRLRELPLTP